MSSDKAGVTLMEDATAAMELSDDAAAAEAAPSSADTEQAVADTDDNQETDKDDSSVSSATADDAGISPEKADLLLLKATGLKEAGNRDVQQGHLDKAARSYRRGVNTLKPLNRNNKGDEQVRALLVTLLTNWSTVLCQSKDHRQSADAASRALAIQPTHVKALYRRAVAQRHRGKLDEAKADLKAAVALDPRNKACHKELVAVKQELIGLLASQKKALAKAFGGGGNSGNIGSGSGSGSGGFLYDDKEEAGKKKAEAERLKKLKEEELARTRKQQWEDDCVALMAKKEDAISFEDWDKQRIAKEEADQAAAEKRKRKEAEQRRAAKAAAKAAKQKEASDSDDDDDELTEAELKMMRGYKKTADGRTTSYFTREQSQEEKERARLANAPQRLSSSGTTTGTTTNGNSSAVAATGTQRNDGAMSAATNTTNAASSVWNQAGTWEEKDTTTWCTAQLRTRLEESTVTTDDSTDVNIVSVEDLTGDASVAVVSGKKRYIFDYHAKIKYEIQQADVVVASGTVQLPDICSTHHDEIEILYDAWKKAPLSSKKDAVVAAREVWTARLRENVQLFVQDFNTMY